MATSPSTDFDYENPRFIYAVEKVMLKVLKQALEEKPPESQIAVLLYEHIKDFGEFRAEVNARLKALEIRFDEFSSEVRTRLDQMDSRFNKVDSKFDEVDSRFDKVDSRLDKVDSRLDNLEKNMFTKQDWKHESIRLLQGIGELLNEHVITPRKKMDSAVSATAPEPINPD